MVALLWVCAFKARFIKAVYCGSCVLLTACLPKQTNIVCRACAWPISMASIEVISPVCTFSILPFNVLATSLILASGNIELVKPSLNIAHV